MLLWCTSRYLQLVRYGGIYHDFHNFDWRKMMSTISTNICFSYGGIHDPFQFDLRVVVFTMISNHHFTCCSRNIHKYNLITTLLVPTCASLFIHLLSSEIKLKHWSFYLQAINQYTFVFSTYDPISIIWYGTSSN